MSTAVLTFDRSGAGTCLYTELIDLQEIGALKVNRASTIEFNNQEQRWEVRSLAGKVLFFSKFRHFCIDWERQHIGPS
jgi:hypothetical protein